MEKINIALIGYGYWGKIVEKYIANHKNYNLVLIHKDSKENLSYIAENKDIDAVYIATPIATHYHLTKYFLKANKHILCEKPLSTKISELEELELLSHKNNKIIQTNYIYLVSDSIKKFKDIISEIGEISYIKGSISQFDKLNKEEDVFSVLGCHFFAILFFLFDKQKYDVSINNYTVEHNETINRASVSCVFDNFICDLYFSLSDIEKERKLIAYGSQGIIEFNMLNEKSLVLHSINSSKVLGEKKEFSFDESNNITKTLDEFFYSLIKAESNIGISKNVTFILDKIGKDEKKSR